MNFRCASCVLATLVTLTFSIHTWPQTVWGQAGSDAISVSDSPVRTWSSPDGKFKREGKLIEILGDRVRLEMADGKSTVAQAAKLSPADQTFIEAERKRMEQSQEDSPFMDEEPATGTASSTTGEAVGLSKELDVLPDFASVALVDLESAVEASLNDSLWQPEAKKIVKRFRIPAFTVHTRVMGHVCSAGQTYFAVTLHEPFGIDPTAGKKKTRGKEAASEAEANKVKTWVDVVDLANGKNAARFPLPVEDEVVGDLAEDGSLLATYDGGFNSDPDIRLYTATSEGPALLKSWSAKDPSAFRAEIRGLRLLPGKRLLVDYKDYLLVMQLEPLEALLKVPNDAEDWKLSSDRSRVIVGNKGRRFEVDLAKGECLGFLEGALAEGSASPSPDGTRFAKFESGVLTLRNAQSQLLDEFYCPLFWPNPQVTWIDDRTIQLQSPHQQHFVDVDRRVVFLEVANGGASPPVNGWKVDTVRDASGMFVEVSQVSAEANTGPNLAEYQQDLPEDADSLLLLQAGDSVRITTQLAADPSQDAAVRQHLGRLMQERGVTIDPNSDNELRATSGVRNDQVQYRSIGVAPWEGGGTQTVNVRLVDQKVELIVAGEVVWQRASTSGPGFMLSIRDGESAQQAADRQSGDGAGFWQAVKLPKHLARHPQGGAWNRVMKTGNGYQKIN